MNTITKSTVGILVSSLSPVIRKPLISWWTSKRITREGFIPAVAVQDVVVPATKDWYGMGIGYETAWFTLGDAVQLVVEGEQEWGVVPGTESMSAEEKVLRDHPVGQVLTLDGALTVYGFSEGWLLHDDDTFSPTDVLIYRNSHPGESEAENPFYFIDPNGLVVEVGSLTRDPKNPLSFTVEAWHGAGAATFEIKAGTVIFRLK